jgi:N-acetylglucosamine-6-phosphate deacetylase
LISHKFIDLQVNGHGGVDLQSAYSIEQVQTVARSLAKHNVAAFLPTIITGSIEQMLKQVTLLNSAAKKQSVDEAKILGIHLEGPFISKTKRGVHPEKWIIDANLEIAKQIVSLGNIRLVTIAPETTGANEVIKFLVKNDVIVSIGHTNCNYEQAKMAFDAGAKSVTHLFNAMPKDLDSGIMRAIQESKQVYVQIIIDSIHCTIEQMKFAIENFANRLIVTNDPIAAAGLGDGEFPFGEMKLIVKDEVARRQDGTLAGGVATMESSVKILKSIGANDELIKDLTYSRALELLKTTL